MVISRRIVLLSPLGLAWGQTDKTTFGLREALTVGLNTAVDLTGRVDGYFRNEAIKILMPEQLKPLVRTLTLLGMRKKIDEFVLGMNRAAEQAAPMARPIFGEAIRTINFSDVRGLVTGGDTSVTDFFQGKTRVQLTVAFTPPIVDALGATGAVRQYNDLMARFQKIPFAAKFEQFRIEEYVVGKALDGLFYMVGQEEKRIRKDPAARVTSILRDVFGKR